MTLPKTHFGDISSQEVPKWKEDGSRGLSLTRAASLDREGGKMFVDASNGQMGADLLNANGSKLPVTEARDFHAVSFGPSNIMETNDTPVGIFGPSNIVDITTQTPLPPPNYNCESPATHIDGHRNGWRVYSRKRGCRKQEIQEKGNEASTGTAKMVPSHQKTPEEVETAPTCSIPATRTEHAQEAISQWELAKALGVTAVTDPDNIINKIEEMEDRDRKEAESMGIINIPP